MYNFLSVFSNVTQRDIHILFYYGWIEHYVDIFSSHHFLNPMLWTFIVTDDGSVAETRLIIGNLCRIHLSISSNHYWTNNFNVSSEVKLLLNNCNSSGPNEPIFNLTISTWMISLAFRFVLFSSSRWVFNFF